MQEQSWNVDADMWVKLNKDELFSIGSSATFLSQAQDVES